MGLIKNPDGSITVQIPRGDEVYDPATGQLVSEFTYTSEEWSATVSKPVEGKAQTWGRAGWLNSLTLPAGLRDLVIKGDSELDYSSGQEDRPAVLKQLDEAAIELGDDGPPVTTTFGAAGMTPGVPDPDHPLGAPTAAAASPAAFRSPPNTRNPRSAEESQEAYEQATEARTRLSAEERDARDQRLSEEADKRRTRAELESVRSAVTQEDLDASGGDPDKAAARAKRREEERTKATAAQARQASSR